MRLKKFIATLAAPLLALTACGGNDGPAPEPPTPPEARTDIVLGADISWLTEMEADGLKFRYRDGSEGDCMAILRSIGMNTFRFRLWVDPEGGWCSTDDVLAKARRAKALGMDVMLDFHYSDFWADPEKQNVPAAWRGLDLAGLESKVEEYTAATLRRFSAEGLEIKWVQVGNETGNGMLWPYGKAESNPAGYVRLSNAGYRGVKQVYPDAKVIVHVQNGQDNGLFRWIFDILKAHGGKYDVIGMSLYPSPTDYAAYVGYCRANMIDMVGRYDKDVMLCEVGMGFAYASQCRDFLSQCIALGSHPYLKDRYLGVLYWEPQVYNDWNGYPKGAFNGNGSPGAALDAFSK